MEFKGVMAYPILDLGVSQLYLSRDKLRSVQAWLTSGSVSMAPLPVHDFGDGRYTLTDGHTRACVAWQLGLDRIPIIYDRDDIVVKWPGPELYRMDIEWCSRFGVRSARQLAGRVLDGADYERLWIQRCERGYNLLTHTTPAQRAALSRSQPALYLYGASADALTFYFEDRAGGLYAVDLMDGSPRVERGLDVQGQ